MKLSDIKSVGFTGRQQQLQMALKLDSAEKQVVVGVHGMGGVGKSVLARQIYDAACTVPFSCFNRRRFYMEVGRDCRSRQELSSKRVELLQRLSGDSQPAPHSNQAMERSKLKNALAYKSSGSLLLVLDDLWEKAQLHWLLGCEDTEDLQKAISTLPEGSRVLLFSRSQSVVTIGEHENNVTRLDVLNSRFAGELLRKATGNVSLDLEDVHMATALRSCGGLPLALHALARHIKGLEGHETKVHPLVR